MACLTRLDLLERGLFEAVADAVGPGVEAFWAYGSPLVEQLGDRWLAMRVISDPVPELRPLATPRPLPNIIAVTLTVLVAAPGRYVVELNGVRALYDADGTETITEIRDLLAAGLAVIAGSENTIATAGPDQITITQTQPGTIRRLTYSAQLSAPGVSDAGVIVVSDVSAVLTVEFASYARQASGPATDAGAALQAVMGMLRSNGSIHALEAYGIKPRAIGAPVDLSAYTEGAWESRRVVTVGFSIPAVEVEAASLVSSLALSLVVRAADGPILEVITITE